MIVIQTCVPDYRILFFQLLKSRVQHLRVYSGLNFFDPSVKTASLKEPWSRLVDNKFLFQRAALWQRLPLSVINSDEVVFAELNPRNFTSWVIGAWRTLMGKPIVFWGHAWARSGPNSKTVFIRLLMWRLCDAKLVYTLRQLTELKRVLPGPTFATRNALYSEKMIVRRTVMYRRHFVYVGRMVADKKPELLLRAFAIFAEKDPEICLDIVGEGPERMRLTRLACDLGVGHRVVFHGHISDMKSLGEIYGRAIAAVSPGYLGLSATQAFFFGVPILVADGEPHSPEIEACLPGLNSVFFPSDDGEALALLLKNLSDHQTRWAELSTAIQDGVCARYSIEKMVDSFSLAAEAARKVSRWGLV